MQAPAAAGSSMVSLSPQWSDNAGGIVVAAML